MYSYIYSCECVCKMYLSSVFLRPQIRLNFVITLRRSLAFLQAPPRAWRTALQQKYRLTHTYIRIYIHIHMHILYTTFNIALSYSIRKRALYLYLSHSFSLYLYRFIQAFFVSYALLFVCCFVCLFVVFIVTKTSRR